MTLVTSTAHAIKLPRPDTEDSSMTRDYSNSDMHRFAVPGSKNFNNIARPSPSLHLSNIPPGETEEGVRNLFAQHGLVAGFKFFAYGSLGHLLAFPFVVFVICHIDRFHLGRLLIYSFSFPLVHRPARR